MKYYYLSRPPSIGTQPAGFVEQETWYPKEFSDNFPRGAFGWVKYDEPLTFYQAWKYDLMPADEPHSTLFNFWLHCDRDPQDTIKYIKVYYDLSDASLETFAVKDEDWASGLVRDLKVNHTFEQVKEILEKQYE